MLPFNFRHACRADASLQAAFSSAFSSDASCTGDVCDCGSDGAAAVIVQQPQFAVSTAIWWMTHGAAQLMGSDCNDISDVTYPGAAYNDDPDACMKDADGDGYGGQPPNPDVQNGTDCDDFDGEVFPGMGC